MSEQVLHLDFIAFSPGVGAAQRSQLQDAAARLLAIEQVVGAGVIEADEASDFDLVFWFLLPDFGALEPFGTHPDYARFLQGSVAPVLRGFAGADVRLDGDFDARDGEAACLALAAPEETYDFEVREALEAWAADSATAVVGLAVGERQMYRGVAIAFVANVGAAQADAGGTFESTLVRGRARCLT